MSNKGIFEFLKQHAGESPVSFHMPGHKGASFYKKTGYSSFMKNIADYDITEIPGADNLFQTEGIIKETAEKYEKLYGVKKSYLLVNGTSCGIIAAITASVPKGKKLIMARNCHKSVFNALNLGGIEPVYAYPERIEEYGITGQISPDEIGRLIKENEDVSAVILPSPNYYGVCSDIKKIAKICHKNNVTLIVDQAHGAHLKFFGKYPGRYLPPAAEDSGADIVINSTHKTLASLTQSAVLNVVSDKADTSILEDKLQAVESTSPSYLLMASLDINADILSGKGLILFKRWKNNLKWFYKKAASIPGLEIMKTEMLDMTKINLDMSLCGIDGIQLERELNAVGIYPELVTGNIVMCMTGIGNTRKDYRRLIEALREISEETGVISNYEKQTGEQTELWTKRRNIHPIPENKMSMNIDEAIGRVCASSIIPYPPGIPLICPGEEITDEEVEYIKYLRNEGEKVMGIDESGNVIVGA